MSIYIKDKDVIAIQDEYKKAYSEFRPYDFKSHTNSESFKKKFNTLFKTQDGQDADDYKIIQGKNGIEAYLCDPNTSDSPIKLLLLGVGVGRELQLALKLGFDAYGITLGSRNIDFGKKYLDLSDDRFRQAIAEDLPYASESFDTVAGFHVFEHAIAPLVFLLEIGRVLKTEGELILEWPPPVSQFTMKDNPHHQICYLPGQAEGLLLKAGFKDIKIYYKDDEYNLEMIPEEEYWTAKSPDKMLIIKGTKKESTQEYINNIWKDKETLVFSWDKIQYTPDNKVLLLYRHQRIFDEKIIKPEDNVLDIGGWGVLAKRIIQEGANCTILDIFEEDQYYSNRVKDMPHIVGDICDVDLIKRLGKYNVITCFEMLEHCKNPKEAIKNMSHILIKGGHLVGTVPLKNVCHAADEEGIHFFTPEELETLLSAAGLKTILIEKTSSLYKDSSNFASYYFKAYKE